METQSVRSRLEAEKKRVDSEIAELESSDPANDEFRDIGTDEDDISRENEDHARTQARIDALRATGSMIERALAKIAEGTYGVCDDSKKPIPEERLEAIPWAIYTVESEEKRESRRR
jgi:DnaK suppressor protein